MSDILKNKIIAKKEKLEELDKQNSKEQSRTSIKYNANILQFDGANSSISFKNKSFMKENFETRSPIINSPKRKDKWVFY